MCIDCGCELPNLAPFQGKKYLESATFSPIKLKQSISLGQKILAENDSLADMVRNSFASQGILAVNLMSSPGSGKTTLLEKTAELWPGFTNSQVPMAAIEGDLQTSRDAERLRAKKIQAYQITTGTGCHLDANLVQLAVHEMKLEKNSILFIENVGNLVCPAVYDVGAQLNVTVLSVPEGDDKIEKYPLIFADADLVIISKTDLIPYCSFSIEKARDSLRNINPEVKVIEISSDDAEKFIPWLNFLKKHFQNKKVEA